MTVIAMDAAPEGVRGELTRWFLELKPGVFIGKVNTRIRDLLWGANLSNRCGQWRGHGLRGPNEQGFSLRVFGVPKRRVNDFEGIQLITIQKD